MSDLILQFHAEWCGPCKKVTPTLQRIVKEAGLTLVRTDIDKYPADAQAWNVKGVPTMIRLDDSGVETHRSVGAKPANMLKRELGIA